MSRGPGVIMAGVSVAVTDDWQTMPAIATAIGRQTNRATIESVRRACKRLAEQGVIEIGYVDDDRRWADIIAERGYPDDARPAHPRWKLAVRRAGVP
jgi:hypothetical protein